MANKSIKPKVQIGHVGIMNKNNDELFQKQLTVDFNSPYIGLNGIEEIRKTLLRKIKKLTK